MSTLKGTARILVCTKQSLLAELKPATATTALILFEHIVSCSDHHSLHGEYAAWPISCNATTRRCAAADFRTMLDERGGGSVLQQLLATSNTVVRMRALSLVVSMGACSAEHASLMSQYGEAPQPASVCSRAQSVSKYKSNLPGQEHTPSLSKPALAGVAIQGLSCKAVALVVPLLIPGRVTVHQHVQGRPSQCSGSENRSSLCCKFLSGHGHTPRWWLIAYNSCW